MNKYIKTVVKIAAIYTLVRRTGVIQDLKEIKEEVEPFLGEVLPKREQKK